MCSLRNENELHFSVDLYKWWFPWNSAFTQYLHHSNNHFSHRGDQPLHLILDLYPMHRDAKIKALANELNTQLHFIPAGMTDKLQHLDRNCFGALKATARRLFRERFKVDSFAVRTKQDASSDLACAWEHLNIDTIEDAWEIYFE